MHDIDINTELPKILLRLMDSSKVSTRDNSIHKNSKYLIWPVTYRF